jgi:hypothetical protein
MGSNVCTVQDMKEYNVKKSMNTRPQQSASRSKYVWLMNSVNGSKIGVLEHGRRLELEINWSESAKGSGERLTVNHV